jgi:hypothetical protein
MRINLKMIRIIRRARCGPGHCPGPERGRCGRGRLRALRR